MEQVGNTQGLILWGREIDVEQSNKGQHAPFHARHRQTEDRSHAHEFPSKPRILGDNSVNELSWVRLPLSIQFCRTAFNQSPDVT